MKPSKRQDAGKSPEETQRARLEKERRILSPETESGSGSDREENDDSENKEPDDGSQGRP